MFSGVTKRDSERGVQRREQVLARDLTSRGGQGKYVWSARERSFATTSTTRQSHVWDRVSVEGPGQGT